MARMYPIMILMGFMMVVIAFIVGYVSSQTAAAYFSASKSVRETTLMAQRASIESVGLWLPYFKFLGLGLILGGIVMALRVIIDGLKEAGMQVMSNLPAEKRPTMPAPPWYGPMMPVVMMVGEMILIVALIVSLFMVGIPMKSSTSSGHVVHLSERSDASEYIVPSGGRHGQGRMDLAP
jgi:hypothetical protein